jgi:DNA-binding response OmpR family regulator
MSSPKGRILCTEDDADTRDLIIYVLTEAGYEVICTNSADQAISLARGEHFDLFLIDSWLPGVSGVDFTRTLREFDVKTPVLFYSGAGYDVDKADAKLAGSQGYLVKPVLNEDLIKEVARLIAESRIAIPLKAVTP